MYEANTIYEIDSDITQKDTFDYDFDKLVYKIELAKRFIKNQIHNNDIKDIRNYEDNFTCVKKMHS